MKDAWIEDAVIYQVNLRALAAREPRNAIEAAREKPSDQSPLAYLERSLPVIRKLGVNVLYLMPPYPIGHDQRKGIGSPYSIRDFTAVDPEYGSLDELRAVVRRAHAVGLRVILDITPNHTSRDHVWTTRHPDFYVTIPGGGLYHDLDWTDTAKLDYRNPALRKAMIDVYDFWLGCSGKGGGVAEGVDGFRLDMAHFINNPSFWDEALPELKARHAPRELLFLAECYGTANNFGLFQRGVNAAYDDDFYKVCLYGYAIDARGQSMVRLSPDAKHNGDFNDKREAFERGGLAAAMATAVLNYERTSPVGGRGPWLARYTDNHDEGRGLYRFGPGAVRAVNSLIFLLPHTLPFMLTGQEFGALNRPPIHDRLRVCDKGRRLYSSGTELNEPGIEIEGTIFDRGFQARQGWYDFFKELIRLRRTTPELTRGGFEILDPGEACPAPERTVMAFERRLPKSVVRCAVNLGPVARTLSNARLFKGKAIHGTLGKDGCLSPFSAVVVRE